LNPPIANKMEPTIGPSIYPSDDAASAQAIFCSVSFGNNYGIKE
jgi:hypothetical protein